MYKNISLKYNHENLTMRFQFRTLGINDQVRFPHISIQVFKHMYSISGKFAVQCTLRFYQLQMNQGLGKTHHRKSANNKGYLKNKERNKYTTVPYRLDNRLSNFEASIQTGAFRRIKHLKNKNKLITLIYYFK